VAECLKLSWWLVVLVVCLDKSDEAVLHDCKAYLHGIGNCSISIIRPHCMHGVQRCGFLLQMRRGLSVSVRCQSEGVGRNREPHENG